MLRKLLNKIPHMTIVNCFRNKYLTRWYLLHSKRLGIYLHLFHRSDEDRAMHDHPWSFVSIILWRGYIEHTEEEVHEYHNLNGKYKYAKRKWPGMVLWRPAEWKHRVELIDGKPALTLIIRFRNRREWGYHMPTGWMSHTKWWNANCE